DREQKTDRCFVGLSLGESIDDGKPAVLGEIPRRLAVPATQPQQVSVHHGQGPLIELVELDVIERLRRKVHIPAHHTLYNERASEISKKVLPRRCRPSLASLRAFIDAGST